MVSYSSSQESSVGDRESRSPCCRRVDSRQGSDHEWPLQEFTASVSSTLRRSPLEAQLTKQQPLGLYRAPRDHNLQSRSLEEERLGRLGVVKTAVADGGTGCARER